MRNLRASFDEFRRALLLAGLVIAIICAAPTAPLTAALEEVGIKPERIHVESKSMASLMPFKDRGIAVIFYSPYRKYREIQKRHESEWTDDERKLIDSIHDGLAKHGIVNVSGHADVLDFRRGEFPEARAFFIWNRSLAVESGPDLKAATRILAQDPRIHCFLLGFKSEFDR